MKGLADSQTTTGLIQRALTDEWEKQSVIHGRLGLAPTSASMLTQILLRLVKEGRAESRFESDPLYMGGGYHVYRLPQRGDHQARSARPYPLPEHVLLTNKLLDLAEGLDKRDATKTAIENNRLNNVGQYDKHVTWLRGQISRAESKLKEGAA